MAIYAQILERILLPLGDALTGGTVMRHLHRLRREVRLPKDELSQLQRMRLGDTLRHASQHAEYYRSCHVEERDDPISWLKAFPILDKRILHERGSGCLTAPARNLLRQSSSGSSGLHSIVYWTRDEQSIHRATQLLWWEWAGYRFGVPVLQTGITPDRGFVKRAKDFLLSTYYMPAFVVSDDTMHLAMRWLSGQREAFVAGYASSLYLLSQQAAGNISSRGITGIVSWGDKLFDHYRTSIESSFHAAVHNTYGTAEGMMIAAQKDLEHMYVMSPNVYLEILDDEGKEVPDGEMGYVVVTSLVAKAMPLIRYRIGDIAMKLPVQEYPARMELALPLMKTIIGRDTDIVRTRSGHSMVVHSFTGIFEHRPEIAQFCVVQNDLNGIVIRYIPRDTCTSSTLEDLRERIQRELNEPGFQIAFERVDRILPTPSGKPQIVVSHVKV